MNCKDCNKELGDKFIKFDTHVGQFHLAGGVCFECAEKYNAFKYTDGKVRDFCEKCGEKFLVEDLVEISTKRGKLILCSRCNEN